MQADKIGGFFAIYCTRQVEKVVLFQNKMIEMHFHKRNHFDLELTLSALFRILKSFLN